MKRRTLDEIGPCKGQRLRVFFPSGKGPQVMVADGESRPSSSDRCTLEFRMTSATGRGAAEWVPGWYVAQAAGVREVV